MQRIQTYRLLIAVFVIFLGACTNEKTIMVSEFLHDPQLLKKTRDFCMENPGERGALPNCINSATALSRKISMSEFGNCYKNDVPNHSCIDEYISKKGIK